MHRNCQAYFELLNKFKTAMQEKKVFVELASIRDVFSGVERNDENRFCFTSHSYVDLITSQEELCNDYC